MGDDKWLTIYDKGHLSRYQFYDLMYVNDNQLKFYSIICRLVDEVNIKLTINFITSWFLEQHKFDNFIKFLEF